MSDKDFKSKQRIFRAVRLIVIFSILALSTVLGLLHQFAAVAKPPGVDAFCPFGGLEAALTLLTGGVMIKRIVIGSFFMLFATLAVLLVMRRSFCGNLCAFGALQELFARIGRLFLKKRPQVPAFIDKPARFLKYLVLVVVVALSFLLADLVIRPYDPWATYHHILSDELFTEFLIGFIVLLVTLVGSVVYDRFFCKYICPMGAFLGIFNRLGWFRISRNENSCIDCKKCSKECPVNIEVHTEKVVNSSECINCNLCAAACPVKDTLTIDGLKGGRVTPMVALIAALVIFGAVIGGATVTGNFDWKQKSLTEEVSEAGSFDPEQIKGRMTFKEVSQVSGVPKERFIEHFKITAEDFELPIKEVKGRYDFDTEEVRQFVKDALKGR